MRIVIVYATTEGQTRKICRFAADHLADAGHMVELVRAEDTEGLEIGRFDAAILAGSVHAGLMQKPLRDFLSGHAGTLGTVRTLYIQVSLAAAGNDPQELDDLDRIAKRLFEETGFTPDRTEHVAGAFRFSEYDFFKAWAMRWIAQQKGETIARGEDREYTDWDALRSVLDDWAA